MCSHRSCFQQEQPAVFSAKALINPNGRQSYFNNNGALAEEWMFGILDICQVVTVSAGCIESKLLHTFLSHACSAGSMCPKQDVQLLILYLIMCSSGRKCWADINIRTAIMQFIWENYYFILISHVHEYIHEFFMPLIWEASHQTISANSLGERFLNQRSRNKRKVVFEVSLKNSLSFILESN